MKFGVRTPSLKRRIAARTSVKRMVRAKVRAPKGFGFVTNPKKAAYNRIYNKTSVSVDKLVKGGGRKPTQSAKQQTAPGIQYDNDKQGKIIRSSHAALSVGSQNFESLKQNILQMYEDRTAKQREVARAKLMYVITFFRKTRKDELGMLEQELKEKYVSLKFADNTQLEKSWLNCTDAFAELSHSEKIWDLTYSEENNRVAERTIASSSFNRNSLVLTKKSLDFIQSDLENIYLPNSNGPDIYIYPTFVILFKDYKAFSIYDILDLDIGLKATGFLEEETVPSDTEIANYTWKKTNKDGSMDKRFAGNYQIPVVKYGQFSLQSKSGMDEVYMFSNFAAFSAFAEALVAHVKRLKSSRT
jgi:hypothetical protein